jgi:hypothetical protein
VEPRRRQPWDCHRTLQNSKTAALKQQEDVCEKLHWEPTEESQCIPTTLQVKEFSLRRHRYLLSSSSRSRKDDITVEPGPRGTHRKFRWSQLITAFSSGRIGGGGQLVVHAQPAQLVVRWWLQLLLQSSLYMRCISLYVARNPYLYPPLVLYMHYPS